MRCLSPFHDSKHACQPKCQRGFHLMPPLRCVPSPRQGSAATKPPAVPQEGQLRQQERQQHGSQGSPLVTGLVSAITESLRLLGVGKQQYQDIIMQPSPNLPLESGMTEELVERLTADFQRAYFVTGLIDDSIYDPDCLFVDPTVQFSGVDLWKRNLQLLVPFLVRPRINLQSTRILAAAEPPLVEADWQLTTWLSLPWRPYVSIGGRTVYTLNADGNKIVKHQEFWSVSALQALLQLLKPGPPLPEA